MKSIIKYILCLLTGIGIYSCDYLDVVPDQIPTLDNAFTDRYTAEKALASCYWATPRLGSRGQNPAIFGGWEIIFNRNLMTGRGTQFALGNAQPSNPYYDYWSATSTSGTGMRNCYANIRDCNTFLENIGKVKGLEQFEKNRWSAEVKLLKAYNHFYLIKMYGPVCPMRESVPVGETSAALRVYREKVDDCFQYVIDLIDEAIDSQALPSTISATVSELGRFTESAAYMMKARALVYWASPLFNGNTDYNSFVNQNGEPFFNQTPDPTRWTKAAEACKAAIEVCEKAGIHLYRDEDYVTTNPMSDTTWKVNTLRNSFSELWNIELIWGDGANQLEDQHEYMPRLQAGSASLIGVWSVPFHKVDEFYTDKGVPIGEDKEWLASGRYENRYNQTRTGDEAHKYYIRQGQITADMNFDREPRFYAFLGFDRGLWWGNYVTSMPADDSQALYISHRYGEYSSNQSGNADVYNVTGYFTKKLLPLNSQNRDANSAPTYLRYAFPEMRYSDLLLLTAEALNETTSGESSRPASEVYQYIDELRDRAGLEGVVDSWSKYSNRPEKPLTKKGMREIIHQERQIELAFEGQTYFDVRRWKTAPELNNRLIQGWNYMGMDVESYYKPVTIYTQPFNFRQYFSPVPESEIVKNRNLIQNPGF